MTFERRLLIGLSAPPLGLVVSFAISTGALGTHPVQFCAIVMGLGFLLALVAAIAFLGLCLSRCRLNPDLSPAERRECEDRCSRNFLLLSLVLTIAVLIAEIFCLVNYFPD